MKHFSIAILSAGIFALCLFSQCVQKTEAKKEPAEDPSSKMSYAGFGSQVKWGEHLVTVSGCNDCHTPKIMTDKGMIMDTARRLSGHPSEMPSPDVNRKDAESKGLIITNSLTAWVGPWGVSFTANLTPDPTGTGNWNLQNFMTAIRDGKSKGLPGARTLLPPMPWEQFRNMTDDELMAIFAYLRSIKPIHNVVPAPIPPISVAQR
jgi:hypothetical protein